MNKIYYDFTAFASACSRCDTVEHTSPGKRITKCVGPHGVRFKLIKSGVIQSQQATREELGGASGLPRFSVSKKSS